MEPENILRNMALYNFEAPINVIFYDESSDDEKKSKKCTIENNTSHTSNSITMKPNIKEEKNKENEDCALVIPTLPKICESNGEDKTFEERVKNETEHFNKIEEPRKIGRRKRKSSDLFNDEKLIKPKISVQILGDISETPQDKNTLDSGSPTLVEDNDDIIKNPCDTISHFLTVIAESYNYHLNISNKKSTKNNKEVSKKHYLEIKYHFFKIAYEIVATHIIPKENDRKFVDEFLNSTIKIADKKTKLDSSKIIKTLYTEMIKWVKQKKHKEIELKKADGKKCNNILFEKSSQPSMLNLRDTTTGNQHDSNNEGDTVTNTKSKNHSKSSPSCLLTPELAGEEISINFNTALSNNQYNKTIINNDISRSQNPLSTMQLFHYLKGCNNSRPLNNDLGSTDTDTDTLEFINYDSIPFKAKEITHNEPLNKTSNKQNDNTVINNDISRNDNIQPQNPISTLHRLDCNDNRPLNNGTKNTDIHSDAILLANLDNRLAGTDTRTDSIPLVNHNNVQALGNEVPHQNMNGINYHQIPSSICTAIQDACNSTIPSRYCQDTSIANNTAIHHPHGTKNTDIHSDAILLANCNNVQPNNYEMAHNKSMTKKSKSSSGQHDKAIMNGDITSNENVRNQNLLAPSQLLNYLQNCNDNRSLNNRLSGTDTRTDSISLVNHNNVQPIGNEVPHNQNVNGINYHQISSSVCTAIQDACNSTIPSRYCQNTSIANNTAIDVMDTNHRRIDNLNVVNFSPCTMSNKNTNRLINRDFNKVYENQILNSSLVSTDSHPSTVSFLTDSQTTSDTSYHQRPSTHSTVLHSPYYHKSIPVSSSIPPRCYQNTIEKRMDATQKHINDNTSAIHNLHMMTQYYNKVQPNAMNALPNQVLNSQHSKTAKRISDNDRILNKIRPPPPVYNSTHYLTDQNSNYYLNNQANKNPATLPQYFPSYVNRPVSSSVIDQRQSFLENRVLNTVQHQELTVQQPPPSREPIRQDHVALAQDYAPSAIRYNVQPEPLRNRSTLSTDSGFASPLAYEDGGMEVIMNGLYDLDDTTSETADPTSSLPVITHVTSLNTGVTLVQQGNCYMCRKIAKQMCSGCYKIYYCSPDCQALDWRIHRYSCGQNKIN